MEEGTELLGRLKHAWGLDGGGAGGEGGEAGGHHAPGPLPLFTSCCPGVLGAREACGGAHSWAAATLPYLLTAIRG